MDLSPPANNQQDSPMPAKDASVADSIRPLSAPADTADTAVRQLKATHVEAACKARDVAALAELAISPLGFATDECRRLAWPLLLGCGNTSEALSTWEETPTSVEASDIWEELPTHEDERQAGLDADRSFVYYPKGEGERQLSKRKSALQALIVRTLRHHPYLSYFQGYHDIVQVLLLVLGPEKAPEAAARLSVLRIRDYMLPSIAAAQAHLELLPYILRAADPVLEEHLASIPPYFGISSTLTLYAHEIEEYSDIARLFDFLLAQPAAISIYLFAVIVLNRKQEILEIEHDEGDILYAILSKLPKPLDLEKFISETLTLYSQHPPQKLPGHPWRGVDPNSVLKTTQNVTLTASQSLEQGRRWFLKQQRSLKRQQRLQRLRYTMWVYRRPARSVGVALAVVVLAYWLRRDTTMMASLVSRIKRIQSLWGF